MAGSKCLGDAAVLARPPDAPVLHLANAGGAFLAQEACEALVAQAAARFERVVVVKAPVVRRLRTERDGDGHLRHHGGAAAADQAAVGEQHAAAGARGLDRRIHAGAARSDDQDVGFDMRGGSAHAGVSLSRQLYRNRRLELNHVGSGLPFVSGRNHTATNPRM